MFQNCLKLMLVLMYCLDQIVQATSPGCLRHRFLKQVFINLGRNLVVDVEGSAWKFPSTDRSILIIKPLFCSHYFVLEKIRLSENSKFYYSNFISSFLKTKKIATFSILAPSPDPKQGHFSSHKRFVLSPFYLQIICLISVLTRPDNRQGQAPVYGLWFGSWFCSLFGVWFGSWFGFWHMVHGSWCPSQCSS